MKQILLHVLSGFLVAVLWLPASSSAQVPGTIAYQGYLTDTNGDPLGGTANLAFRLYDAPAGGTALWAESQLDVPLSEGIFAINLGAVEPLDEVAFDRPLWLAVQVNGGNELSPRVALTASPYALSTRGLRVIPGNDENDPPSILAGDPSNALAEAGDEGATISGGTDNTAGRSATVGGGEDNAALSCYDTVAGGVENRADGLAGGNKASGARCGATVGGGNSNVANNETSTVAGGYNNEASGSSATVGGGTQNTASGRYSAIPGGSNNIAAGAYSFAAGRDAEANHDGTFIWSNDTDSFASTAENQFLIQATGGVGIGTNAPEGALHVTHPTDDFDLILGGAEQDQLFGDDGVIASDPNLPSSDLLLVSNDAVGILLNADNSEEDAEFIVSANLLNPVFIVDDEGAVTAGQLALEDELGASDTPAAGGIYKDNVVYAWAHVNADGTVVDSYGCTVSRRTGFGSYRVTFNRSLPNGASAIVTPKGLNDVVLASVVTNATFADVATKTFNGTAFVFFDSGFYIQVVGRP